MEKDVERYLTERVEKVGGKCIKFSPDGMRGVPDRIVLFPLGKLVWVELKDGTFGRVSDAQKVAHVTLRRLGQVVEIVRTKEEADRLVMRFTQRGGECGGKES